MIRWLLNAVPTWALVLLVVGGFMVIAGAGLLLVLRRWPHFIAGEHNDVAEILLGIVGATYGRFTWLFGMRRLTAQLLMVVGVGALIGFSVLIALMIDHPFSGGFSISSAPFREGSLAIFRQP